MSSHLSRAARAGIALSVLLLVPFAVGSGTAADIQPGTLTAAHFRSAVLGEDISYNVYLLRATRAPRSTTPCCISCTAAATR